MKKILSLIIVLALCAGVAVSGAETTVSAKEFEAKRAELNTASNLLIITDKDTRMKYVADTELNPLSEQYDYVSSEGNFFTAANEEWHYGLLDTQGKLILPLEYAKIEVISDKWIAGIHLVEAEEGEEKPDYRGIFNGKDYMVESVDIYYAGEKKGTLTRDEWDGAKAYGDYLVVENRERTYDYYNKEFAKTTAGSKYNYEYNDDSSTKTVTHPGSNQTAFAAGCVLTAEEVFQNVWLNRVDRQLLDLQGNVLADFSAYKFVQLDSESGLVKLEGENGKVGLADSTGREIVPCKYDRLSYALAGALLSGYIYAEKDGMIGFVNLETGAETGFSIAKDAGDQRANFIIVKDTGEGKCLISAAAGELPGRYQDVNAFFPNNGDACLYAVVKEQDGTCHVIGQKGEEILPGVTFKNTGDAKLSEDGTLILVAGEDGKYTLYTVAYDPE